MPHPTTYQRLAYVEADSPAQMRRDARRAEVAILLRSSGAAPAPAPARPAHRDVDRDEVRAAVTVDEAARRLADALLRA